jgi:ATP-dependent Clp protease, protease subunit
MKNSPARVAILGLSLATCLSAKDATSADPAEVATPPAAAEAVAKPEAKDPVLEAKLKEKEALELENKLSTERLTSETTSMRAEIYKIKLERDLAQEKLSTEEFKRQAALEVELSKIQAEKERLAAEGELSKTRAEKLANDYKIAQTEAALKTIRLKSDIEEIETTEKRAQFADSKPVYLKNPLKENGILVISDRRIPLNGPITSDTADFITTRIQYWNNKDREMPIFIVIDGSPGGSVMAGYRILKSMESSDAPVHVVVKSYAASMAAAITTLAKESYAYPNAMILHHQISNMAFGRVNLTEQREFHEENKRWWDRFGTPIAAKMGITADEFIKKMYARSTSGDWPEFADKAVELKWVNHVIQGVDETSFTKNPDTLPEGKSKAEVEEALKEQVDAEGRPYVALPRLAPMDAYFIHNPDNYYRLK